MFIFILGLGLICDEFRIWVSNLVRFYFIKSLSRFCISCLFRIDFRFMSNCYLCSNVFSSNVVSYRAVFSY